MEAPKLSSAELEVLRYIADGLTDKEIAAVLCKSFDTIRTHRSNLLGKTSSHNRVELTRYAIGAGFVSTTWENRNQKSLK